MHPLYKDVNFYLELIKGRQGGGGGARFPFGQGGGCPPKTLGKMLKFIKKLKGGGVLERVRAIFQESPPTTSFPDTSVLSKPSKMSLAIHGDLYCARCDRIQALGSCVYAETHNPNTCPHLCACGGALRFSGLEEEQLESLLALLEESKGDEETFYYSLQGLEWMDVSARILAACYHSLNDYFGAPHKQMALTLFTEWHDLQVRRRSGLYACAWCADGALPGDRCNCEAQREYESSYNDEEPEERGDYGADYDDYDGGVNCAWCLDGQREAPCTCTQAPGGINCAWCLDGQREAPCTCNE